MTKRHIILAKIVHQQLAKDMKLFTSDVPHYKYQPTEVLEINHFKLYSDKEI
jgi:hypothetical protein